MKRLLLADTIPDTFPTITHERSDRNLVAVCLDFWSKQKLQQLGIPCTTPIDYLGPTDHEAIDSEARNLTEIWYNFLEDRLVYAKVPLGQMAEYDFLFLFIDALRSIQIAKEIFAHEDPTSVDILQRIDSLGNPNAICYESLPQAVKWLAEMSDVPVRTVRYGKPERPREAIRGMLGSMKQTVATELSYASRRIEETLRGLLRFPREHKDTILFIGIPFYDSIAAGLDDRATDCISLQPSRILTGRGRMRVNEIRHNWSQSSLDPAFTEQLTYDGFPLVRLLRRRFDKFFESRVPELIETIDWTRSLIRLSRPSAVVVPEDVSPVLRSACRVFRLEDIPVLALQNGALSVDIAAFHVMPVEGNLQAVWGDLCKEWHIKRGKPSETQIVTGNPGFDPIATGHNPTRDRICRMLEVDPNKGIITLATDWFAGVSAAATIEHEEVFIRNSLRALRKFPSHQVIVKLHPTHHIEYRRLVSTIADQEGTEVTITKDHLWDILAISDVVIVANSTVGVEAMILGKPVVSVQCYPHLERVPYAASGAALDASSVEDIEESVAKALGDEQIRRGLEDARKDFVYQYAYSQDGEASARVAELIRQMTQKAYGDSPAGHR